MMMMISVPMPMYIVASFPGLSGRRAKYPRPRTSKREGIGGWLRVGATGTKSPF